MAAAQLEVVQLQQQVAELQNRLQQCELSQPVIKQPLQEQQLPQNPSENRSQNPVMAEAVADGSDRPRWQNPMAAHLSEAEKSQLQGVADAGTAKALADENGATQSLLSGNPGLLQWEEKKKMQHRIDALRAKLKV